MASILEPVIRKLVDLLAEEVVALRGVRGDVESLRKELEIIQPLLREAEGKTESDDTLKVWVRQIREEADRIENVVASYQYGLRKMRSETGPMAIVGRASHFVRMLRPRHQIPSEIRSINKSLREIKDRAPGRLRQWDQPGPTEQDNLRLEALFLEEEDLVGIGPARSEIVDHLVGGPPERVVISIVGEGGVGKTTLCKSIFEDEAVKHRFESAHVWITVSKPYDPKKILKKMTDEICKGGESSARNVVNDSIEDQIKCLRNDLKMKRYLFVFDDVWEENFWEEMKLALPDMKNGSRILITTRNGSVANSCKKSPNDLIHSLEPWSEELANELFCKKAFGDGSCPQELTNMSMEIVRKCQGLPLVIAAIASLLATKEKVPFEWRRVLDDLNSKVEIDSKITRVQKILSLGYYDLPHHLRSCFLYFGVFPEDYSISDERLYRLWIAEGFIEPKQGKTLEEVAEGYMVQLIRRNLVLFDQSRTMGEGKYYRVHDLMRDVILTRAEDLGFLRIWDAENSRFRGNGRRLIVLSCSASKALEAFENAKSSEIRSLFLSNVLEEDAKVTKSCMLTLLKKFKLLEVLDVENIRVCSVPRELGSLFSLKYLSLRKTIVKSLPTCISNLQNLHSLDVRDTLIREIPKEINKLTKLRHILAYSYNPTYSSCFDVVLGVSIQLGFGNSEEMQTLAAVEAHRGGVGFMEEMAKLSKLRWLDIINLTTENGKALCDAIGRMNHLERLCLFAADENEIIDVKHVQSPPISLRDLLLVGRLERLPEWIPKLHNLSALGLAATKLIDDPIKFLKGLPNLDSLLLIENAYEGEELHFEEDGFLKLKMLSLYNSDKLKAVKFDSRALPVLECFRIVNCRQLREVPSVQHLKHIKLAEVDGIRMK